MVASYVLNPSRRQHNLEGLVLEQLNHPMTTYEDVAGKGSKQVSFDRVSLDAATAYSAEDADYTLRLSEKLTEEVEEAELAELYYDLEMPLIEVLVAMERWGVKVDGSVLRALSKELERQLDQLAGRIYTLAGEEFNINSPVQLRTILFEKLGLPVIRRTKTGPSTDQGVLEQLASQHDLPAEILNYRGLSKLKSTYVDALPELIHPDTGRIHTSFNQTVTATGRLSSSDPNLQNIPIRTELGRQIRRPLWPGKAGGCSRAITTRSSFASWPTSRATRSLRRPSPPARTSTPGPPRKSSASSPRRSMPPSDAWPRW